MNIAEHGGRLLAYDKLNCRAVTLFTQERSPLLTSLAGGLYGSSSTTTTANRIRHVSDSMACGWLRCQKSRGRSDECNSKYSAFKAARRNPYTTRLSVDGRHGCDSGMRKPTPKSNGITFQLMTHHPILASDFGHYHLVWSSVNSPH